MAKIDCVIIGHNTRNFQDFINGRKSMAEFTGAYRDAQINSILLDGQRLIGGRTVENSQPHHGCESPDQLVVNDGHRYGAGLHGRLQGAVEIEACWHFQIQSGGRRGYGAMNGPKIGSDETRTYRVTAVPQEPQPYQVRQGVPYAQHPTN